MNLTYKYLYTRFHVFGSLPTHKVFKSETGSQSKLVFADQSFIYGLVSDWLLAIHILMAVNLHGSKSQNCF